MTHKQKTAMYADLGILAAICATVAFLMAIVFGSAYQSWLIFFVGTGIGILAAIVAIVLHAKSLPDPE